VVAKNHQSLIYQILIRNNVSVEYLNHDGYQLNEVYEKHKSMTFELGAEGRIMAFAYSLDTQCFAKDSNVTRFKFIPRGNEGFYYIAVHYNSVTDTFVVNNEASELGDDSLTTFRKHRSYSTKGEILADSIFIPQGLSSFNNYTWHNRNLIYRRKVEYEFESPSSSVYSDSSQFLYSIEYNNEPNRYTFLQTGFQYVLFNDSFEDWTSPEIDKLDWPFSIGAYGLEGKITSANCVQLPKRITGKFYNDMVEDPKFVEAYLDYNFSNAGERGYYQNLELHYWAKDVAEPPFKIRFKITPYFVD
jgi:hypothetical protein